MYYVTVVEGTVETTRRKPFEDYFEAIAFFSQFFRARSRRSVLSFTTEVINGQFARSYVTLTRPESLDPSDTLYEQRYHLAVKQDNAFKYDSTFMFLVESEVGTQDADQEDD